MTGVLITGASRGIGAELALQYVKHYKECSENGSMQGPFTVAIVGRTESSLQEVKQQCQKECGSRVDIEILGMHTYIKYIHQIHT